MAKLLASFVISAISVSVVLADEPQSPLRERAIENAGYLQIIDGQPKFLDTPSPGRDWHLYKTDKGWSIQTWLDASNQKGTRYLAVDKDGKFELVTKLGEGAYWKLNLKHIGHLQDEGEIQVSGGKFDGWYLGHSDKTQEHAAPLGGSYKFKMYDPELSEKSGDRTKIHLFVDGP